MKICNQCNKTFSDDELFCDVCGAKLSYEGSPAGADVNTENSKGKKATGAIIVLSVLLALSVVAIAGLVIKNNNTSSSLNYVRNINKKLSEEAGNNQKELEFYHTYIGLVETDANNYYHRYDCEDFTGEHFVGYNIKNAESEGYTACPKCFGGE